MPEQRQQTCAHTAVQIQQALSAMLRSQAAAESQERAAFQLLRLKGNRSRDMGMVGKDIVPGLFGHNSERPTPAFTESG
jgi:hypothetical protein